MAKDFKGFVKGISDSVTETTKNISVKTDEFFAERNARIEKEKAEKAELQRLADEEATGYYVRDGKLIITTVPGMNTWLTNLGKDTTPALMQALQMQLEVLQYVQSPSLTGMALDSMILCLDKAVKISADEQELNNIREAFASMIQCYFFLYEVNFRCAQLNNKKEGLLLLRQSGDLLTKAVVKTASVLSRNAIDTSNVDVRNVFDSSTLQDSYFSRLFTWFGEKKSLEAKETEFYNTLDMLFETMDKYANLLGQSILIQGMLSRYRKLLVDYQNNKRLKMYVEQGYSVDSQKVAMLFEGLSSMLTGVVARKPLAIAGASTNLVTSVGGLITDFLNKNKTSLDIEAYCNLQNSLELELEKNQIHLRSLESDLSVLNAELRSLGLFNISQKKESQKKIEAKEAEIAEAKRDLDVVKNKLAEMKNLIPDAFAFKTEMDTYNQKLLQVENKFI